MLKQKDNQTATPLPDAQVEKEKRQTRGKAKILLAQFHEPIPEKTQPVSTAQAIRLDLIAREAYLRAEQRGFQGGSPLLDWLEAEAEVDRVLDMD